MKPNGEIKLIDILKGKEAKTVKLQCIYRGFTHDTVEEHKKMGKQQLQNCWNCIILYSTVSSSKETFEISSLNRSLMSEGEKICDIDLVIYPNNHLDLDLLDFCLDNWMQA